MAKSEREKLGNEIKWLAVLLSGIVLFLVTVGAMELRQGVAELGSRLFERYVSPYPMPLIPEPLSFDEQAQLLRRVVEFGLALEQGRAAKPLTLGARDLGFLLSLDKDLGATLRVTTIKNGRVQALISLRRLQDGEVSFLNGWTELQAVLKNGQLMLQPQRMNLGGKELKGGYLEAVKEINALRSIYDKHRGAVELKQRVCRIFMLLRSVDIQGSDLILNG